MTSTVLIVGFGSALGGMTRFWVSGYINEKAGPVFPWGTMTVNVVGSFVIGLIATLTAPEGRWMVSGATRDFAMLGFLGGFTTFSSFSLNTLNLLIDGEWLYAGANAIVSLVACLIAVWAGHTIGKLINL